MTPARHSDAHVPIYRRIYWALLEPSRLFTRMRAAGYRDAFLYHAGIAFVCAFMNIVAFVALGSPLIDAAYARFGWLATAGAAAAGAVLWLGLVIFNALVAAVYHVFVKLVGGKGGLRATYRAVSYGFTAYGLLGWIPLVGSLFVLPSLYATARGAAALHRMPVRKAFWALVAPVVIVLLLAAVFALALVVALIPFF